MALKGWGRLGQKLGAPWGILGLAALGLGAQRRDGLAVQAFEDDQRWGFGIPVAAWQGCPPVVSAPVDAVPRPLSFMGSSLACTPVRNEADCMGAL